MQKLLLKGKIEGIEDDGGDQELPRWKTSKNGKDTWWIDV